jgi:two-component system, OmpR family, phosphate regulon sensor histidine kinase PhoR
MFLVVVTLLVVASHWLSAIWLGLTGVALALAGSWLVAAPLAGRLSRLQDYSQALARAESADAIPDEVPDFGNDEIGDLAGSLRDIAPGLRKLAERLGVELARREAILGGMIEGVLVVDREMRISFCNPAFARIIGAPATAVPGALVANVVRDPEILNLLREVLYSPDFEPRSKQVSGARGRSFDLQAVLLENSGAMVLLRDITELERLERVRRDFVANVSHELRTPLTAIRGAAETLLDGALEDLSRRRRFVEMIASNAIHLTNISSDLLALSSLESGKVLPPPSGVTISDCINAALSMVESEAGKRGVELSCGAIPGGLRVLGYRDRLDQVLINLLHNAVKFNRPGGSVHVTVLVTPEDRVAIVIADTGIGIPSEDLPRVFERFYRVDKARSREVGGTGLGLSIVKHAVEQMHGDITVESTLGKGSRFTVILPKGVAS